MDASQKKKNSVSREQAGAIYEDLRRTMTSLMKKHKGEIPPILAEKKPNRSPASAKAAVSSKRNGPTMTQPPVDENPALPLMLPTKINRGHATALGLVALFALAKVVMAVLDASGIFSVGMVQASISGAGASTAGSTAGPATPRSPIGTFTREELAVLTTLDNRRAELEERSSRLDAREADLTRRDREYLTRQAQLKDLTDQLRADRDKRETKRNTQIDQLANVYGSMNPPEAASLIEQLDVHIALDLLGRMPEKRIGQILSLMNPERALTITRMLSGKIQ